MKKLCKTQREWRTLGTQGPLNQSRKKKTYMKSKRLNKQAKGLHEFAPSPLHINITASGLKFYGTPEYVNERFCDAGASS